MKKLLALLLVLSAIPALAFEQDGFYIGAKTGIIDIDASGVDTDASAGLLIGWQADGLGVEFEATSTNIDFGSRDGSLNTFALYGVYRSEGELYFKAKLGVLKENVEVSFLHEDDVGLSVGLGGGYRFGKFSLEAEATIIEEDANFFSIGLNYHF